MLLLMRSKFVYSCSIKTHALGFSELWKNIFCLLLVVEAFSLLSRCLSRVVKMFVKSCQDVWEVVVGWWETRWIWRMRHSFLAQFVQRLKRGLCEGRYGWEELGFFDQCWLYVLQFSVHLIDLLSMLLRCNDFAGIQKAVVDQTNSKVLNSDHDLAGLALGSALKLLLSPATELVVACCIEPTFHRISQSDWEMVCCVEQEKTTLQNDSFFGLQSAYEAPTYWPFSPFQFTSNAEWLENSQWWVLWQLLV